MRRAVLARRIRIGFAIAAAAFVIYRLVATFTDPGPPH